MMLTYKLRDFTDKIYHNNNNNNDNNFFNKYSFIDTL